MYEKLLESFILNDLFKLQNRIVFAPSTRCFADKNLCATDEMAEYYSKRADAGLIISEATLISKQAQGYPNQPGIYNEKQISSWQNVNKKIHKKGAISFCQLFHAGRVSHEIFIDQTPVSPSKTKLEARVPRTDLKYGESKELSLYEIEGIIEDFVNASINSISADFDGVELHCANGYLPDQFLHQDTNKRDDKYGGTFKKRATFVLELVDRVIEAIGKNRIGIRLSPHAYLHMDHTKGDEKTFIYLLKELEKRELAYVHTGVLDDKEYIDYLEGNVTQFLRKNYNGVIMANGSYSPKEADSLIKESKADVVSFSRAFIANSDLVSRLIKNEKLDKYDNSLLDQLK